MKVAQNSQSSHDHVITNSMKHVYFFGRKCIYNCQIIYKNNKTITTRLPLSSFSKIIPVLTYNITKDGAVSVNNVCETVRLFEVLNKYLDYAIYLFRA